MGNRIISIICALLLAHAVSAQQYYGMNGLVNVPSADMDTVPVAHVGAHFLNEHMIPDIMTIDGKSTTRGQIIYQYNPLSGLKWDTATRCRNSIRMEILTLRWGSIPKTAIFHYDYSLFWKKICGHRL